MNTQHTVARFLQLDLWEVYEQSGGRDGEERGGRGVYGRFSVMLYVCSSKIGARMDTS